MRHDILAIGDIVIDAFIRLQNASVHCKINSEDCEICMRWGDKIPYEFAEIIPAVGNSANAAVSAARLGLNAGLRAYVGDDRYAQECYDALLKEKVDSSFVEKASGKHTNYHYVLWYETERTILVRHETFEYTVPTITEPPRWLYLSSLGENSLPYHQKLMEALASWPDTKLCFQPGTYQMKFGTEALKDVYARTDIFFCNKSEAERILKIEPTDDKIALLKGIRALGVKIAVITDDRKGAYAMDEKENAYYVPMYPDVRAPKERTGAGDSFASSVTSALALGLPLEEALLWGPINAMNVVQEVGAQKGLLTRAELEKYLKDAPAEYKLSPLPLA